MVKILYALVVLAVIQYGAADEQKEYARAAAVIAENLPAPVTDALEKVGNVVEKMPSLEQMQGYGQAFMQFYNGLQTMYAQLQQLSGKVAEVAPGIIEQAVQAGVAAAKEKIMIEINNPEAQEIIAQASGIAGEAAQTVETFSGVAQEITDAVNNVVAEAI